jgi:hypothetical protein
VSIYRWGFKISRWADFAVEDWLNRPWSNWQTAAQTGQTDKDWLNRPGGG